MDKNLSSAPRPAERPVKPVLDTVLAAADKIDDTQTGSAAMVRDAARQIPQAQGIENKEPQS